MVQRLQTTRSLQDARRAFVVNAAGDTIWMLVLSFVGLALFAYFQRHTLPPDFATDRILPYFHVADLSRWRPWTRDCVDSRGVAVERRLGDQRVHVRRGDRLLSPVVRRP